MNIKEKLKQSCKFIQENQNGLFKIVIILFLIDWTFFLWDFRDSLQEIYSVQSSIYDLRFKLNDICDALKDINSTIIGK